MTILILLFVSITSALLFVTMVTIALIKKNKVKMELVDDDFVELTPVKQPRPEELVPSGESFF